MAGQNGAVKPLEGIRVLDLTRVLAGPFAARMLCDLGADVVKVEPPEGDVTRHFGVRRGTQTGYYAQQNAGTRAVCIDFSQTGGPELVRRLAASADVVMENFRPGVLAKFGLDWDRLCAEHPELVMVSISGFGQEGPERNRAAYAGIIHAESGWLARQARIDQDEPSDAQLSVADTSAGLHSLVATFAALRVRDETGVGQHIDIAMVDTFLANDDHVQWAFDGVERHPGGGGEIWTGVGGPIMVMGDFKWVWKCAHEILGLEDPTPPGADLDTKIRARREAWADYLVSFGDRTAMLVALDRANLAWGAVKSAREALASPTLRHRGTLVEVDDRVGGTRKIVGSPYRFSHSDAGVSGPAPLRGEHNRQVLEEWIAMDSRDIDALKSAGVVLEEHEGG